jgi:hypothetical protein
MRKSRKKTAENFIQEADIEPNTTNKTNIYQPPNKFQNNNCYKIYTFSLDEATNQKIDNLTLKTRTIRTNRSEVIRAAIIYLEKCDTEEFENLIKSVKKN